MTVRVHITEVDAGFAFVDVEAIKTVASKA
jgi:hypothetical protein